MTAFEKTMAPKVTSRKKLARTGAAAVMVTLSSVAMVKAIAATATMPILSKLIRAVEITINTSLDFGDLAVTGDHGGQARVDPVTNLLVTDSDNSLVPAGGRPRAGRLHIRGSDLPVQVSMEQNAVKLTDGDNFVTVDNFNFINNQAGSRVTVTPDVADNGVLLSVGATLKTSPGQMSGNYIGSNRIFANYQ